MSQFLVLRGLPGELGDRLLDQPEGFVSISRGDHPVSGDALDGDTLSEDAQEIFATLDGELDADARWSRIAVGEDEGAEPRWQEIPIESHSLGRPQWLPPDQARAVAQGLAQESNLIADWARTFCSWARGRDALRSRPRGTCFG